MSDVTAFNNCINVFWRQHEAELSRFLTSKTGDSEKAADLLQELFLRARAHSDSFCEMENPALLQIVGGDKLIIPFC